MVVVEKKKLGLKVLPCKKWITTGQCPYGDRCDYLHPESIKKEIFFDTEKKNSFSKIKKCDLYYDQEDKFFWPPLTNKENYKNENYYTVSHDQKFKDVRSLWIHFERFLKKVKILKNIKDNTKSFLEIDCKLNTIFELAKENEINKRLLFAIDNEKNNERNLLGNKRLDIFVTLSKGIEIK